MTCTSVLLGLRFVWLATSSTIICLHTDHLPRTLNYRQALLGRIHKRYAGRYLW